MIIKSEPRKLGFRDVVFRVMTVTTSAGFLHRMQDMRAANQREKEKVAREGETPTGYPIYARERLITSAQQMRTRAYNRHPAPPPAAP